MSHILTLEANNQQLANQNSWKRMKNVRSEELHFMLRSETLQSGAWSQKLVLRLQPAPGALGRAEPKNEIENFLSDVYRYVTIQQARNARAICELTATPKNIETLYTKNGNFIALVRV